MTSFERAERNQRIVTARLRGFGERRVAETHGVSERHVRRVVQEYRANRPALHEQDPAEALQDALDAYQALIDEAVTLADQAQQEGTRVAALKLRLAVLNARTSLVPGLGLVPAEVERARMMADFQRIARKIVVLMDRHGVPPEVQQEVVDTVEGRLPAGSEPADGETPDETSAADCDSVEPVDADAALAGS